MYAPAHTSHQPPESEYEDLLSLWSDLESGLSVVLARPLLVQDFAAKVRQFDHWLQDLVAHDIDAALGWLARQPGIDPKRLAYMGYSYGGGVAMLRALWRGRRQVAAR